MKKIVFTGGSGRFATVFKKIKHKYKIEYPSKKQLNIENFYSVLKYLEKKKPSYLIHCAGLSRPMKIHEKNIAKSINLNIIGTSNVVKACQKNKVKLIYFSTNYVYPCKRGPYSENSSLNPINNYGWSKLGGESAVKMYKNSLILRLCMTEKPFIHKKAFSNVISSFIYHEDFAKNFKKIINQKGVINVGGKRQSVFSFVSKNNKNIKPILSKDKFLDNSINIKKYRKLVK